MNKARQRSEAVLARFSDLSKRLPQSRHTEIGEVHAANLRGTLRNPSAPADRLNWLASDVEFRCEKLESEYAKAGGAR